MKLKELLALIQSPVKHSNEERRVICVQVIRIGDGSLRIRAALRGVGRKVHRCNAGIVEDVAPLLQALVAKSVPVLLPE